MHSFSTHRLYVVTLFQHFEESSEGDIIDLRVRSVLKCMSLQVRERQVCLVITAAIASANRALIDRRKYVILRVSEIHHLFLLSIRTS